MVLPTDTEALWSSLELQCRGLVASGIVCEIRGVPSEGAERATILYNLGSGRTSEPRFLSKLPCAPSAYAPIASLWQQAQTGDTEPPLRERFLSELSLVP